MIERKIAIKYSEYASLDELPQEDAYLIAKAREVSNNAWAPYSNFRVGAAVLLKNEKVITGNNQENVAYPSGLCAERVALFAANANYPNSPVRTIAISAFNAKGLVEKPVTPCGACRQAILESEIRFEEPIRLLLDSQGEILIFNGIKHLLPLSFDKDVLND